MPVAGKVGGKFIVLIFIFINFLLIFIFINFVFVLVQLEDQYTSDQNQKKEVHS